MKKRTPSGVLFLLAGKGLGGRIFCPASLGVLWVLGISVNLSLYQLQRENLHNRAGARWKCTPSAAFGGVSPRESVSHDSQSPAAPYESCSLATPEGEILAVLTLEMLMSSKAARR